MKKILCLLLNINLIGLVSCQEIRTVKVKITEEGGTPIEGVDATVTFLGYSGQSTQRATGKTNELGFFEASGKPELRMSVRLEKEGYYGTDSGRLSRKQDHDLAYVLRKVRNPIPLYAKKFRGKLPSLGKKCGFDFEVGDWVAPDGKGKIADIFFQADILSLDEGKTAGKLEMTFLHEKDGVVVVSEKNGYLPLSNMLMPHLAFGGGYSRTTQRIESGYQNEGKPKNTSYFLRTRAKKMNEDTYQFNFSKLKDGIEFFMSGGVFLEGDSRKRHPQEVGVLTFTYSFNPNPNDRNLEFDPTRNLFEDLDVIEQVREP